VNNTRLLESDCPIDHVNAAFYSRFQYPWRPMVIRRTLDPSLETRMLGQSIGGWEADSLPERASIWVAGCGANQAVLTALRFPDARVRGSDLSAASLAHEERLASELGVGNLTLAEENLNSCEYFELFDYVICTGVIHHNANPESTLRRLRRALRPRGLLELMVYHAEHMRPAIAIQRMVRLLAGLPAAPDFDEDLAIAGKLLDVRDVRERIAPFCIGLEQSDAALADALIQPIAYSYRLDSLTAMVERADLRIVAPYIGAIDRGRGVYSWTVRFEDPDLRDRYERLPDHERRLIADLLRQEDAPMLWFYLQRSDSTRRIPLERELREEFLARRFRLAEAAQQIYVIDRDSYRLLSGPSPHVARHPEPSCQAVIDVYRDRPGQRMTEALASIGADVTPEAVDRLRLLLTTSAFPYLLAMP
jgi:SAM-dependent methyltransferase